MTQQIARHVAQFVSMVGLHFPIRKMDEQTAIEWMRSMNQELCVYAPEVLQEAAAHIRRTRDPKADGAFFPAPSECITACNHAKDKLSYRNTKPLLAAPKTNVWSDERCNLADDLIKTEIGRRAAREGWIQALWDFARKEMRLPNDTEVLACCASAQRMDAMLEKIESGAVVRSGVAMSVLQGACAAVRARRAEKAAKALGEDAA